MNALTLLWMITSSEKLLTEARIRLSARQTAHELLERVTTELRAHEKIEEDILYPR